MAAQASSKFYSAYCKRIVMFKRHISYSFLNNYWCAKLAQDMEETKQSEMFKVRFFCWKFIAELFQIPYFIVEEELKKEDDNVNRENKEGGYVSAALR